MTQLSDTAFLALMFFSCLSGVLTAMILFHYVFEYYAFKRKHKDSLKRGEWVNQNVCKY